MNILIVTDTYPPNINGAAYFTYRLANALSEKGHEVSVMCPSDTFEDIVIKRGSVTEYRIRSISLPDYYDFRVSPLLITKKTIREVIMSVSPDIIHIQNHFMLGKGAVKIAKELDIPVVGTNHFMPENLVHYLHLPGPLERKVTRMAWKQCVNVFDKLDSAASPTVTAAQLLNKAGYRKEVIPISCGIDLSRFNPSNDGVYLRKRFGIPLDKPAILYLGRMDKEKKIDVILSALPLILEKTEVHLILAGTGKEEKKLKALAERLRATNSVSFTGFIPDEELQDIYGTADLFVIAGVAELQSIVTMEAMATGLPVVAVNAMALPELVRDGENGFLFPDGDSRSLAEKVIRILSDESLKSQMSKKSQEIISKHDINSVIKQYESFYENAISHRQL